MGTIAVTQCVAETVTAAAWTASAVSGDVVQISNPDVPHVLEFWNDAVGSVTPTIANQTPASVVSNDYGLVQKADLSGAVAADAFRAIYFSSKTLKQYLNASNQIALTYSGGDVDFKVRCLQLG